MSTLIFTLTWASISISITIFILITTIIGITITTIFILIAPLLLWPSVPLPIALLYDFYILDD